MNKTKIKITGYPISCDGSVGYPIGEEAKRIHLSRLLRNICRSASKIGDEEVVNNTQLGRLRDSEIPFEKI